MKAGKLRCRVTLQEKTGGAWETITQLWTAVETRDNAGQLGGLLDELPEALLIRTRYDSRIEKWQRLLYNGVAYKIKGVADIDERRKELLLGCDRDYSIAISLMRPVTSSDHYGGYTQNDVEIIELDIELVEPGSLSEFNDIEATLTSAGGVLFTAVAGDYKIKEGDYFEYNGNTYEVKYPQLIRDEIWHVAAEAKNFNGDPEISLKASTAHAGMVGLDTTVVIE